MHPALFLNGLVLQVTEVFNTYRKPLFHYAALQDTPSSGKRVKACEER